MKNLDIPKLEHLVAQAPEGANMFDPLANCYVSYEIGKPEFRVFNKDTELWKPIKYRKEIVDGFIDITTLLQTVADKKLISQFGGFKNFKKHYENLVQYHDRFSKYKTDRVIQQLENLKRIVDAYADS